MSITTNNNLQIRQPFEIHCGLMANQNIAITYTVTGDVAAIDSNISDALSNPTWPLRNVTDFYSSGIPLDGSEVFLDDTVPASAGDGKIGIRTDVGGSITISGTASRVIPAITVFFASGTGSVTFNSVSYIIRSTVVIPINATSFTITVTNTGNERIVIPTITAGTQIEWSTDDIISVNLDLRSNLDIIDPTFEISAIEIRAYYPDDISEAVAAIGEGEPVWYYAGIDGDFSETRNFYISDKVIEENNIITISGEDRAEMLEDVNVPIQRLSYNLQNSRRTLYRWFVHQVEEAGIPIRYETEPPNDPDAINWGNETMVFLEGSLRDHLANIMAYGRNETYSFYPRYVDAGIPTIEWSRPTAKWDIYEDECGDVQTYMDRNIAKITTDSDYGMESGVVLENSWETIESDIKVKAGKRTTKNFGDQWYWQYDAEGSRSYVWTLLDSIQWISDVTGRVDLRGKEADWMRLQKSVTPTPKRNGYTAKIDPMTVGGCHFGTNQPLFPNWDWVFARSNKGGSFTWKGDPRMQPRDVFNFHRLDGSILECTIETIELTHEDGGTIASITYREGVV